MGALQLATTVILMAATAARAEPLAGAMRDDVNQPRAAVVLSLARAPRFRDRAGDTDLLLPAVSPLAPANGVALGPLRLELGSEMRERDGLGVEARRAQFAHLRVDGLEVLGGAVSGSFDGRRATLQLSWPTGR